MVQRVLESFTFSKLSDTVKDEFKKNALEHIEKNGNEAARNIGVFV